MKKGKEGKKESVSGENKKSTECARRKEDVYSLQKKCIITREVWTGLHQVVLRSICSTAKAVRVLLEKRTSLSHGLVDSGARNQRGGPNPRKGC